MPRPVDSRALRLRIPRALLAAIGAIAAALLIGACGGEDEDEAVEPSENWELANADERNTRWVTGEIDSSNVDELGQAWSAPIEAQGSTYGVFASTPVVADGIVYTQDLDSNVSAIELESGEVEWTQEQDSPNVGPNGVIVVDGVVYGATTTDAFALDAETGEERWRVEDLPRNDNEGIDMAPGYHDGTVYVSTVPGNPDSFYAGNGQGIVWALDAETGETQWKFETVPEDLWGNPQVNSGGGLWHPPAFDEDGSPYVAVANPGPFAGTEEQPWGQSRPGENLYTNSCVKLNQDSGEVDWHHQVLPHDIYDWDLHNAPILAEVDDEPILLCSGKLGYVYGIDPESGEELWATSVGRHNNHDDDNLLALEGDFDQLPEPPYRIFPGILGGVETQMAINGTNVFVPVNDLGSTVTPEQQITPDDPSEGTGEMVSIDIGSGEIEWQHDFDSSPYGGASVVNDLVFTTTFDGRIWALNTETGEVEWEEQLPAGTNAQVMVDGDTVVVGAGYPQGAGEESAVVAFRLGAEPAEPTDEPEDGEDGEAPDQAADGQQVFGQSCASCHVLAAANATGTVGPSLDQVQPGVDQVRQMVINGGGGMPAFEGRLSDAEIDAVAEYVARVAGQGDGGGGDGGPGSATP